MMMNYLQTNQPFGVDVAGRRGFRWILSGVLIFLASIVGLGAETVVPLVTPAITPVQESPEKGKEPGPVLGFTPLPEDAPVALPVGEGAFGILPGDPNAGLFILDGNTEPLIAINPLMVDLNPSENIPVKIKDPAEDPLSGDLAGTNDLASLPWPPAGRAFGSGISRGLFTGFSNSPGVVPIGEGLLNTLRQGFSLSAAITNTYDSNPSQGFSANSSGGDFFTTLGGTVAYGSTASIWTYGVNYTGGYNAFLNQSDLSGYNQIAGAVLNYEDGPLAAGLILGMDYGSGANRNYASVVDEITYSYGLHTRYRVSGKTSLTGNISQRFTDVSGGTDTNTFDLAASALWRYSPLTEFGPGLRYSQSSGASGQDRTTFGPTLNVNYKLAQKVSLNSTVGLDFVSYGNGDSPGPSLFSSVELNYRASSLWGMSLSLLRDAQASTSGVGEFEETTALRLGYNRQIRRVTWTTGLGWETRSSDNPNPLIAGQPDSNYLTIDTGLSMPLFNDRANANVFMRYQEQSGRNSWESLQTGFGMNWNF